MWHLVSSMSGNRCHDPAHRHRRRFGGRRIAVLPDHLRGGMQLLGGYAHPEVSMHTPPLAAYAHCFDQDDWKGVAELMLASASKLAKIGADFLICPDNSLHRALPHVEPRSPVPWLDIAAVVAEHAAGRGFRRVGLTGMRALVESEVYPDKL